MNTTSHAVRCMARTLLVAQAAIRHEEALLGRERAAGRDRIVVPQHDLAARRQEGVERVLANGSRRAGQHVRGRADLEGDPVIGRPGQDGGIVGCPRAMPDPGHAEPLDRFDDALGRTRLGGVCGQPQTGGRGDSRTALDTGRSTGRRARRRRHRGPRRRPRRPRRRPERPQGSFRRRRAGADRRRGRSGGRSRGCPRRGPRRSPR